MRSEALIVDSTQDGAGAQVNLVKKSVPISVMGSSSTPYMIAKWDLDKTLVGTAGVDQFFTMVIKYKFTKKTPACKILTYFDGQFSPGALDEGENVSVIYPNLRWGISIDSLRLYAISASGNGGDFGSLSVDWVCLYEGKLDNPPLSFMPSSSDLSPSIRWVGTSLQVNGMNPVNLKGEKGDIGTFSPEQSQMLEHHDATLSEHGVSISELKEKFGNLEPSILINSDTEYLSAIAAIEQAAQAKSGSVCSTIRLTNAGLPIILPCPELLMDREITIARVHEPLQACAMWSRAFYIHTNKSSSQVGIVTPGAMPFTNFVYRSSLPSFSGCKGYELSTSVTGSNKFRAISDIDCSQALSLTFRAIGTSRGVRWLLMDASVFDARVGVSDMERVWGAVSQVRGEEQWTAKMNGIVIPRNYITASNFTITDKMSRVTYNGSSRTVYMTVPSSLPDGFEFRIQNNSQNSILLQGASVVGGIRSLPRRSIYEVRKDNGSLIIYPILPNLDSSTGM
ncbi:hypothetical protein [Porphyromonas gingivalis]|uniref:Tail fiber protein n=1 Tax=Porphyromonas phage phage018a_AFR5B1 TaxID=3154108 RepID=A0AAT9J8K8_9CAUD|nr:hypothetical protein [Porphyromonas gingivalis]SJL33456.1 hypothetical protein PGIN_AFR-5B1_00139 [Porphyromonas gingivalis]